ncbi:MAG: hypothetical protein EKK51_30765 [Mycolicibacterium sp.]|uniref:PucR family transcriptional regulator n=1 Tax=Mycolicibacterium sp. TaxID=2320850 RepID=UPI000FA513E5|nr:helix-turn-helix domain-containing protein [Mycolicibacterium sp.]RUP26184.1 MAG: hypothetical protein EKK51_30765 [Mycolicibacterium sp.]
MNTEALVQMVEAFSRRRDAYIADALNALRVEVPALVDPTLWRLLVATTTENVLLFLDVLANGIDPQTVMPPSSSIAHTKGAVRHGIPLSDLLRAYRFGQKRLLNECFKELPSISAADTAETVIAAMNISAALHDRVTEQIAAIYAEEAARRVRDDEAIRQEWIAHLLTEPNPDIAHAESVLRYRLAGTHLAVEAWVDDASAAAGLHELVPMLRTVVHGVDDVLVVGGELQRRVWLRLRPRADIDLAALTNKADSAQFRVALGRRADGSDGFRATTRTAARVRELAISAAHRPQVVAFDDVASVALLADEPTELAAFVATSLGSLADADPRCELLRETIRVFLATNRSYADTAKRMTFHRNTIYQRVQQAVEQHALRLDGECMHVVLALDICRWYGAAVLRSSAAASRP